MRDLAVIFGIVLVLAGCGSTDKDRAISGGGIGAGLGTATGLVIGGLVGGFVLGGVFGAATGFVTDQSNIDLGEPIWDEARMNPEYIDRQADNGNETKTVDDQTDTEIDETGFDSHFEVLE